MKTKTDSFLPVFIFYEEAGRRDTGLAFFLAWH